MRGLWFGSSADALYSLGYMCDGGVKQLVQFVKTAKSQTLHMLVHL